MRKSYSEKLRDPRWQKKRLEILQRDKFRCQCCKTTEIELHVHHIEYCQGEPWEVDDQSLVTLCRDCHKMVEMHGGGQPPRFASWDRNREEVIFFQENYLVIWNIKTDHPLSILNHRYLRRIIEILPGGWLEDAEKYSEELLNRMRDAEEGL